MKIAASDIRFSATYTSVEHHEIRESLQYWTDRPSQGLSSGSPEADPVRISPEAREAASAAPPQEQQIEAIDPLTLQEFKISLLKLLLERMLGTRFKDADPEIPTEGEGAEIPEGAQAAQTAEGVGNDRAGWGLVYDYSETHYEAERVCFSASGLVRTADGQEIAIQVDLAMSREFFSHTAIHLRAGDALKDPLVINFGGTAAQLTERHFSFDLDADGLLDRIAFVREGSGFLALDKNGDGLINDGSELFGPRTGNGFAELAAWDEDGNLWIDENDAVFHNLRIWTKDAEGQDHLLTLADAGIGAIFLGSAATPFALKSSDNHLLGAVRATGLYLREDGLPGTIQQLDLAV